MKTSNLLLCGVGLLASAFTLTAQDSAPAPAGRGPHGNGPGNPGARPHLILNLDANHDQILTADELANAPAAILKLDQNHDGQITRDELPVMGRGRGRGPAANPPDAASDATPARPLPPILAVVDLDHDGALSSAEIAGAPAALATLDKNGDGTLTREELRPADRGGRGPAHRDERGGGRGRGPHGPPAGQAATEAPAGE